MRLLLDSHALLWYTLNDANLSDCARDLIVDPANEIHVGAGCLWELAIKVSIGKLTLQRPFDEFVELCLVQYGFRYLTVDSTHAVFLSSLPYPRNHRDPFDRLLIAQAIVGEMALLSADVSLDQYPVTRMW